MNAPKGTIRTTLPSTIEPTTYLSAARVQGLGVTSLSEREILLFSLSTSRTTTSTVSPSERTSLGFEILPQLISEIWISPPRSTNAPKSVILDTVPVTFFPASIEANTAAFFSSASLARRAFLPPI